MHEFNLGDKAVCTNNHAKLKGQEGTITEYWGGRQYRWLPNNPEIRQFLRGVIGTPYYDTHELEPYRGEE